MTKHSRFGGRRGMTIIEMLVALVVFTVVIASAFAVLRSETRGMRLGSERADALQNVRFTASLLELDLRTLGANVPDDQPFLVYGGPDVVAFNADYATNVAGDPYAVYYDADAPTGTVTAVTSATQFTIPRTAYVYPDTSYPVGGAINSRAETIVFFFTPDSSTARTDDYALFRQVNTEPPELVSRNILKSTGVEFFEYLRLVQATGAPDSIALVPNDSLPLAHSAPVHGSAIDTGRVAWVDSVRGVRINFTVTNGSTGSAERLRTLTRLVRLPNAGLAVKQTCGDEPILGAGVAFLAILGVTGGGDPMVSLQWNQATDETSGELDVTRYVIWRRPTADPEWGEPYLSIPPGEASYVFEDVSVTSLESYMYALAAQDCTPSLSPLAQAGPVVIP